jgi:serine/threonine protein kinase
MPRVKCPYCDNAFEWTEQMGVGRIECPLCNKKLELRRGTGVSTPQAKAQNTTTAWGTEGFKADTDRADYGEIKKGDIFGGFRVEEMVGAGAMAVVYSATQLSLDRKVALKILPRDFAKRPSFVRQFDSETELLASLNHPNIVSIIDRGHEGDTYYFAMEFVEGTTLAEMLTASELDEEFFMKILEQCADAMSYAHGKGVIHRDIKPANIMLNDQGMVKIADFGVAGLISDAAETGGKRRVMGTRGYMAPEQEVDVRRTDARSDIFSFGAVLYRALTNTVPDRLPARAPSEANADVDPRLGLIVLKCLEVNPDRRYQTAEEFQEAVRAYHRELTRAHEVCPNCKKENPPTQRSCLHCGADLSELFDACPECGHENRIDVDICMSCGTSISQLRQQIAVQISKIEDRARSLAVKHRYDEAVEELRKVADVKGKVFQRAREKAERLVTQFAQEKTEYFTGRIAEGKELADKGRLSEAMEALTGIPEDLAGPAEVPNLILSIKSKMALAKKQLEDIPKLLAERKSTDAAKVFSQVRRMWATCPGLEDAEKLLKSSKETEEMVQYELAEARKFLEQDQMEEARQAMGFALSTMPDNPAVKQLLRQIERKEKAFRLMTALAEAQRAQDEERFQDSVRLWRRTLDMVAKGDARREKVIAKIQAIEQAHPEVKPVLLNAWSADEEESGGSGTLIVLGVIGTAVVLIAVLVGILLLID